MKDIALSDMQTKLIDNLSIYRSWEAAAIAAGYSEKSANNIKQLVKRNPRFLDMLKSRYNSKAIVLLNEIGMIEEKVVQACLENIDNLPKFKSTIKELKQTAGVLAPDHAPQQVIQVTNIRSLMAQINTVGGNSGGNSGNDVIDSEVISDS